MNQATNTARRKKISISVVVVPSQLPWNQVRSNKRNQSFHLVLIIIIVHKESGGKEMFFSNGASSAAEKSLNTTTLGMYTVLFKQEK